VLWSSDKLETKALVRGALRQIDQFGQKSAAEGNFKISIIADPGQAEIQKSDIFKIKHENVIMNVTKNEAAGVQSIRVDSLPAGTYNILQNTMTAISAGSLTQLQVFGTTAALSITAAASFSAVAGASIYLEVIAVNTASNVVTFRAISNILNEDGTQRTLVNDNLLVGTAAVGLSSLGIGSAGATTLALGAGGAADYSIGNKVVLGYVSTGANANAAVTISGTTNPDWFGHWGGVSGTDLQDRVFGLAASAVAGKDVHFRNFYLNTANGTLYESDIVLQLNNSFAAVTAGITLAGFEAAYVGQVAKGDVQLRDLDKFWDANGRFMI
jgi:flagellin